EERWRGTGQPGTRFQDEQHPYALDLDLFGAGSLFELLCTAQTRQGEDTLANWLRAPAAREQICARQAAVAELKPRLDLREELAVFGSELPGADFRPVAQWGVAPAVAFPRSVRTSALVLALLVPITLIGWI